MKYSVNHKTINYGCMCIEIDMEVRQSLLRKHPI